MKENNKKMLVFLVAAIVISSTIATVVTIGMENLEGKEEELPLFVKIFADKSEGYLPHSINFSCLVDNYEGNLEYDWNFGDGETSEDRNPSHTYEKIGTYICTANVTDSSGEKNSDSIEILVKKNKPPVVTLSINQNTIERKYKWLSLVDKLPVLAYAGNRQKILMKIEERKGADAWGEGRLIVSAQVDDPEDDEIVSFKWVEHTAESTVTQRGVVVHPKHYFEGNDSIRIPELYTWAEGRHIVKLTVEDSAGNKANASIDYQVEKSTKKVNRESKLRNAKNLLNFWVDFLNPFIGPIVAGLLLSVWKYSNFTGIKLVTAAFLKFVFQLDMDNTLLIQAKKFLDEHPRIMEIFDESLITIKSKLRNSSLDSDFINDTIDQIEGLRESLGLANKRPVISNPFPEENSKNIPINCSYVSIDVNDTEGDPFDIFISGNYVNNVTYTNQNNGTFEATLNTPLPEKANIYWDVEVIDSNSKVVTGSFKFKTFIQI